MRIPTIEARGPAVDADDFADLFHTHAARLVRLAALLGDPDPEDAVQEAFCKVYDARGRLRRGGGRQRRGVPQPDGRQPRP